MVFSAEICEFSGYKDTVMRPPFLHEGDTIGISATARYITEEDWKVAAALFEQWGLKVKFAANVFSPHFQLAGSVEERTHSFLDLYHDAEVKAILIARGGYGTVHTIDTILPHLDGRKWVCGYSDVTVLLNALSNKQVAGIHSTMPISFQHATPEALQNLKQALFGQLTTFQWKGDALKTGIAEGEIVGGNLSVIYSQLGSATQLQTQEKILFLEDVDEMLYHVDRMLIALKRAGMFDGITGLVLGGFTQMKDNTEAFGFSVNNPWGKSVEEMITEHCGQRGIPIAMGMPAGHMNDNRAFYMGVPAVMEVGAENTTITWK